MCAVFTEDSAMNRSSDEPQPDEMSLDCTHCSKSFILPSETKKHLAEHTGVKPFTCPDSGRPCTQKSTLETHKEGRNCRQEGCAGFYSDVSFSTSNESKLLRVVQAGVESVNQSDCAIAFTASDSLMKYQQRCLSNEKPYVCCECGKSFLQAASLKQHLWRLHLREESYVCSDCGKAFSSSALLNDHHAAIKVICNSL